MNPNRSFERRALKKPESLWQRFSKLSGDQTPQKKIRNCKDQEEREKKVVKVVDHMILQIPNLNFQIPNKS
jgi:hypothetical protein